MRPIDRPLLVDSLWMGVDCWFRLEPRHKTWQRDEREREGPKSIQRPIKSKRRRRVKPASPIYGLLWDCTAAWSCCARSLLRLCIAWHDAKWTSIVVGDCQRWEGAGRCTVVLVLSLCALIGRSLDGGQAVSSDLSYHDIMASRWPPVDRALTITIRFIKYIYGSYRFETITGLKNRSMCQVWLLLYYVFLLW